MKQKVLHVVNSFLPPTQKWLEVLLIYLNKKSNVFAKYCVSENINHFDVNEFSGSNLLKVNLNRPNLLTRLKVKVLSINNTFSKELNNYFVKNKYQLLHAHFADIACQILDIKLPKHQFFICSFYGWDYEMLPYTKKNYVEKYQRLFKKVDYIITEGPHGKKVLIDKGCDPIKVKIIPLGIEIGPKKEVRIKPNKKLLRLIQVASFREKKGQLDTVKAVHRVLHDEYDIELTLIGDNGDQAYYDKVISEIENNNLQDKIIVRDFIHYHLLEEELEKHDVFIQPSCYASNMDCEGGAPTTLFHALNVGLPIVATDHCDIPFVVTHDYSGKIVKEKDIDALAEAIRYFCNINNDDYSNFSRNAILDVRSRFDIQKNAKKLKTFYTELIDNNANNTSTTL